jgi:anti-anti-sigma factor
MAAPSSSVSAENWTWPPQHGPGQRSRTRSVGAGCRQLVLDLTGVEFLGSHGLKVLADTAAVTAQGGHGLLRVAVGRSKRMLRPIQLAGLNAVLALHENVEDAIAPSRE